ncbi:hypothetical protein [Roseibium sp. Sym1]|uniref:hypothetical protein n=1 Tax=Roseibium sp. Sym1 TaxID=3016006 RepID=UPI0022B2EB9E|nr:hypothetical protein [Roseibium sp. Sym1]
MDDMMKRLFDDLDTSLSVIEARFTGGMDSPVLPDDLTDQLGNSVSNDEAGSESGNDQTGDVSGKISALNDRFRQNQSTADDEIKGRWILGDDIEELPGPTKAAIKKKVREYADFEEFPLHDRGTFEYRSKDKSFPIIWMIKAYEDETLAKEVEHPEDPAQSYRVLLLDLSDETGEED